MNDLLGGVTDSRTLLEKLASKIPGVGGYLERENRRHTDKVVRDTIAKRYEEQVARLSEVQTTLVDEGAIEHVDDIERAVIKLRAFVDGVRTAAYGYSGFFDTVKVNEAELARLYEYDLQLLASVDALARAIDTLNASLGDNEGLPAAIRNAVAVAQDSVTAFDRRKDVLTGL